MTPGSFGYCPALVKAIAEIDIAKMFARAVKDAPEPVRMFVEAVDPVATIAEALVYKDVEMDTQPDADLVADVQRDMERSINKHIKELSKQTKKEIGQIRNEIVREVSSAPPEVHAAIESVEFRRIIENATEDVTPVARRFVEEIAVEEMVQRGLRERGGDRYRSTVEGISRQRQRAAAGREDAVARRRAQLERRLDRITEELERIREELNSLQD